MRTCAMAGAGMQAVWPSLSVLAADAPVMSIVKYKNSPKEEEGVAEEADRLVREAIKALGGMSRFVSKGDVVWLKPNMGWDRKPEYAANTNPAVVATLIKLCDEAGAKEVIVSDNTCNKEHLCFANSGIQAAAEKAGARVFFLDQRKYKKMAINGKALKEWEIYADAVEVDKVINVPIAKHHGLSEVTMSMKNLMGVIGGARNRFHQDITNTLPDLSAFIKPDLIVIDAIRVLMANGPRGGNLADVERRDIIAAGTDPVALDAFGTTLLNKKPEQIGHIVEAANRKLGVMDYKSLNPQEIAI
ncbi:MAG: DUF362 domain-containing protein [Candidatus Omnitrophota bacterium]